MWFCYIVLEKFILRQFDKHIKVFHSNNGGEFASKKLRTHFQENGILHQLNCPHTPEQLRIVERRHRLIVELGLALLYHSGVPVKFWVDSFSTAVCSYLTDYHLLLYSTVLLLFKCFTIMNHCMLHFVCLVVDAFRISGHIQATNLIQNQLCVFGLQCSSQGLSML